MLNFPYYNSYYTIKIMVYGCHLLQIRDEKRIKSGLAWHVENDNYPNVITY